MVCFRYLYKKNLEPLLSKLLRATGGMDLIAPCTGESDLSRRLLMAGKLVASRRGVMTDGDVASGDGLVTGR